MSVRGCRRRFAARKRRKKQHYDLPGGFHGGKNINRYSEELSRSNPAGAKKLLTRRGVVRRTPLLSRGGVAATLRKIAKLPYWSGRGGAGKELLANTTPSARV